MKNFDYSDINLIPKMGIVKSRSLCQTSFKLGNNSFKVPIIPANMASVVDMNVCKILAENGYFYIMHRFDIDTINFLKYFKSRGLITSISVGVTDYWKSIILKIKELDLEPDYITIDIAHGHSIMAKEMTKFIKSNLNSFLIVGNISTTEALKDLKKWGADAVKAGIAGGSVCKTSHYTGFGSRGFQASMIKELCDLDILPVIADGSIVYPGDIAKAIALGANSVMAGSLFSGLIESPGELIIGDDGEKYKEYWGSASDAQSGKSSRIEGIKKLVEYKDKSILNHMTFLEESLQSSISYGGGNKLLDLRNTFFKII
jgi:GMP reductase